LIGAELRPASLAALSIPALKDGAFRAIRINLRTKGHAETNVNNVINTPGSQYQCRGFTRGNAPTKNHSTGTSKQKIAETN